MNFLFKSYSAIHNGLLRELRGLEGLSGIIHWIASLNGPKLERSLCWFYCLSGVRLDEADTWNVKNVLNSDHTAVVDATSMGCVLSRARNEVLA